MQFGCRSSGPASGPSTSKSAGDSQTNDDVNRLHASDQEHEFGTVGAQNSSRTNTVRKRKRKNTAHSPRSLIDNASQSLEEGGNGSTNGVQSTLQQPLRDARPNDAEDHHETIGDGAKANYVKIYQAMENASKLKLQSGRVIEDVIFEALKNEDGLSQTALGWWIIDLVHDWNLLQSLLDKTELAKLLEIAISKFPELSVDVLQIFDLLNVQEDDILWDRIRQV